MCHFYGQSIGWQVVTEKQLVKHLQKEVARLNAELQSPEPTTLHVRSLLMEKDRKIQQVLMLDIGVKAWITQTHCYIYASVTRSLDIIP